MVLSKHGEQRLDQRGISPAAIAFAMRKGKKIHKQGVIFHVVLDKHIRSPLEDKYRGLVVITNQGRDVVITAYKNAKAIRAIKRAKSYNKYRKIA